MPNKVEILIEALLRIAKFAVRILDKVKKGEPL